MTPRRAKRGLPTRRQALFSAALPLSPIFMNVTSGCGSDEALDPLSLLCRLAACVPPARYHVVKYAGVLAAASPLRKRIAPQPPEAEAQPRPKRSGTYRPWAELLRRTFGVDVLDCPNRYASATGECAFWRW